MEPVSTAIVGYLAEKVVSATESAVKTHVIERWSRYRARQFFEAFSASLLDVSTSDEQLRTKLDDLLADETRSQVVFDAYRSVCLTKSRNLGPRIIAFLTAELVAVSRVASEEEEAIFAAAEELTDSELDEVSSYVQAQLEKSQVADEPKPTLSAHGSLVVPHGSESIDATRTSMQPHSVAPLDLGDNLGRWALKLKRLGLIADDVSERFYRYEADTERYIDEPGTAREITWSVTFHRAALRLATLVKRAAAKSET